MNAEQSTSPFLTENNTNTPKSKAPLIITISLIAIVVIAAVIVALVLINSPKNSNQETANNASNAASFDDSFKYIDGSRLKQTEYTFEDINKGFSYASISFTGTKGITIKHVPKQNPYNYFGGNFSFRVNFDHNGKKIPVLIESANAKDANKTIETINQDCENDKNCHSDYLSGAKTLLITKSSVWTFYSSTKSGQLISYTINPFVSEDIDIRDDSTARNILAKVAMTISDDNVENTLKIIAISTKSVKITSNSTVAQTLMGKLFILPSSKRPLLAFPQKAYPRIRKSNHSSTKTTTTATRKTKHIFAYMMIKVP